MFCFEYIQVPRGLKMISNSLPLLNYPFKLIVDILHWMTIDGCIFASVPLSENVDKNYTSLISIDLSILMSFHSLLIWTDKNNLCISRTIWIEFWILFVFLRSAKLQLKQNINGIQRIQDKLNNKNWYSVIMANINIGMHTVCIGT